MKFILITAILYLSLALTNNAQQSSPINNASPINNPNAAKSIQQSDELREAEELNRQVVKLYKEGKYNEAMPLAKRVVELREKILGEDNYLTGIGLKNLAAIYMARNRYGEAIAIYGKLLSNAEKNKSSDQTGVANALADLAIAEFAAGNLGKAEPLFQRETEIREKNIDKKPWDALRAYTFLARLEQASGQYDKAEANYTRAVEIAEKTPGKVPEDIVPILEGHACLAYSTRRDNKASHALERRISRILSDSKDKPRSPDDEKVIPSDSANGGGVLNGKAISKPLPSYPATARRAGVMGTVVIYITVDEIGKVIAARAVCGPSLLRDAAIEAARQARFTPTLLSGQPVKVTGTISYNFELR
ncbi:MAG: hypothetical protein NVSMB56_04650 [Pyrinomonadaceae bacterium]